MKHVYFRIAVLLLLALLISTNAAVAQEEPPPAAPEELTGAVANAFSYQGYLEDQGNPEIRPSPPGCDFIVKLYGSSGGTDLLGVAETRLAVAVIDGYFILTDLDFNTGGLFRGDDRYLDIQVRCPGGSGSYTTLTPRQKIMPVPYASMAVNLTSYNPNNRDASVNLDWWNDGTKDWPRIRYGGNNQGANNGFKIQGSQDKTLLTILDNGNLGLGTTDPGTTLDVRDGPVHIKSGSDLGTINWYDEQTANLYQVLSVGSYSANQPPSGFGFVYGSSINSPIIWMYDSQTRNSFQVRKKGYNNTVQNGLTLFEVKATGDSWTYGTASSKVVQIRGGSDFAEPFDIAGAEKVKPGMAVAIDTEHPGQLRIADQPFLHTVAGCVSGAGGVQPGLVMQQEGTAADGDFPVALSGRVYCLADASYGPIRPGDLLTTSSTPGYVMVVSQEDLAQGKAFGAIMGKAMTALSQGKGLILVLVTLQ